jgi:hypothetical protein
MDDVKKTQKEVNLVFAGWPTLVRAAKAGNEDALGEVWLRVVDGVVDFVAPDRFTTAADDAVIDDVRAHLPQILQGIDHKSKPLDRLILAGCRRHVRAGRLVGVTTTALASLPPDERDVIDLLYGAGVSHRTAGGTLHLAQATVERLETAALRRLRGAEGVEGVQP